MARTLQEGVPPGQDIVQLHAALNWHLPSGDQLPVTGPGADAFGPRTKAKVKEFQKRMGFTGKDVDGVVGKGTRPLLFAAHDINVSLYRRIGPTLFPPGLGPLPLPLPPLPPLPADADVPQLLPGLRPLPGLLQILRGQRQPVPLPLPPLPGQVPPISIEPSKLHFDNFKLQAQDQQTVLKVHSFSSLVVAANVTVLTQQKGEHVEVSIGPQVAFNSRQNDSSVDGSLVVQVSESDVAGSDDPNTFSVALFTQATLQRSLSQIGPVTGQLGVGAQLQFTILEDTLQLFWQAMPFLSVDSRGTFLAGAQLVGGLSVQVLTFGDEKKKGGK